MKKLLIILTLGLMFGQTEWESRLYEIDYNDGTLNIITDNLVGLDIDDGWAEIINVDVESANCNSGNVGFSLSSNLNGYYLNEHNTQSVGIYVSGGNTVEINNDKVRFTSELNTLQLGTNWGCDFYGTIYLLITAEFPDMDTGYMEEDFDFCINEGLNLVSYPCENDIAINDALPSEISNNLSSIVGEGVAGVNVNGTWVGSLTELQAGSGYWFKSSIEACFNYECVEN